MSEAEREILAGLELLRARLGPGPHTQETIAAWCGLSFERVRQVEREAIAKMRTRLKRAELTASDLA